ncbi:serine hydrolase domain-containing protein [Pseudarthrobacter cellobiosi]|uniref:serine hydrolase domain-containing protein n=1 Tax=Pseudarthrobacter cellobiosi TaxID=2953654 RepID=UPI00208F81BE|nr:MULTISPECIES: serine hydrolase domain-containing protein [unclassified Pseudarthrobacter]MCO4255202.1 beta-lactamase family protein [Pseudarthrobacter sp. HLT1-5]MCO4275272.1 beta-lactamase family protein [Pseudarthrobacter sp. HLT3-5]
MSEPRKRPSPVRFSAVLAAIVAVVLTGCIAAPPAPVQVTRASVTYRTILEEFSKRMLDLGAPAVLIEARIDGETFSSAGGVRSLETSTPAEVTDPVHVASFTKSMVAVSVLKLVEEGIIQLQGPAGRHLPEFDSLMKPPGPVTVEHLLRHTSGTPNYHDTQLTSRTLQQALTQPITAEEILALTASVPWVLTPGDRMLYANANYIALGLMVQRLRGQPIAQIFRSDIIDPHKLTGTHMTGPGPAPANMDHGFITIDGVRLDTAYLAGLTINLAHPPGPLNLTAYAPSNELAWEVMRIARKALDSTCLTRTGRAVLLHRKIPAPAATPFERPRP